MHWRLRHFGILNDYQTSFLKLQCPCHIVHVIRAASEDIRQHPGEMRKESQCVRSLKLCWEILTGTNTSRWKKDETMEGNIFQVRIYLMANQRYGPRLVCVLLLVFSSPFPSADKIIQTERFAPGRRGSIKRLVSS